MNQTTLATLIAALIVAIPAAFSAWAAIINAQVARKNAGMQDQATNQTPVPNPWWKDIKLWKALCNFAQAMLAMAGLAFLFAADPPMTMRWVSFAIFLAAAWIVSAVPVR